ncbi:MAG: glutaredoxin family protein [Bacillota bacterium]
MEDEIALYYFPACPFCRKVLNYIEDNDLKDRIVLKNTRKDKAAKDYLIKEGGKDQVPCLFIEGRPLYESDDIINWLKENM